ncbi:MAG TPA: aldehyde dehydrogenase family protein [Thermoleophilaceae bacterium]|nr:aldehyde dehydrogenase family protein [Thermoleophilaceae bacterium]
MAVVEEQRGTEKEASGSSADGGAAESIPVENPATGQVISRVLDMDADEVEELVRRARRAQPAWEALGFDGRAEVMYEARAWLVENRDRMLRTIMEETGKTREDAIVGDWSFVCDSLGFWAKRAPRYLKEERVRPHSPFLLGKKIVVRHRPVGVVGVIGPWNFPLNLCFGDAIAALTAGNAVVLKPSEVTPLSNLLMAEGMRAAGLPEDVMAVATGRGETGAALVDHADMIMFTGSTATGRRIMARAAETLTPVSLELGGKDPMIVLRDADIERAANLAVSGAMANGGQICTSVERVYVEEPVYDEFVTRVVDNVRSLRQGAPAEPGSVDVGAVTFPPQADIVDDHVRDAVAKGARVLVGGERGEGPGRFFRPTVLTDVDHSMKAMTEETFGPTLPIMRVRDEDEAVRLANDSPYGLNSSVWTRDLVRGEAVARRIEAGNTCVNDGLVNFLAQEAPFGGIKSSGVGARHAVGGIRKYTNAHTILITRFAPKREIHTYPYTAMRTRLMERLVALVYGRRRRKK